jgi:hypothetical protein
MNLNPIAKWIVDKEPPPRSGPAVLSGNAGLFQSRSQRVDVGTLQAEVSPNIPSCSLFLDRQMEIQSTRIKPHAGSSAHGFRLGDLGQTKQPTVEVAGLCLPAWRHRHVDMSEPHLDSI